MPSIKPKAAETTKIPRPRKAVLTDAMGVAEMLACNLDEVWRGRHEGRIPAPLLFSGEERWRIAEIRAWVVAGCPDRESWERRTVPLKAATARRPKPERKPTASPTRERYDNFTIPRPGKSVFAWAKAMEKTFGTDLIAGMGRDGGRLGCGDRFLEWSEEQVNAICMEVIHFLRSLPSYEGQFERLFPKGSPAPPWITP
jgi:hypothetical protein